MQNMNADPNDYRQAGHLASAVERIHEVPIERINQMFVANEGLCLDCGFEDVPDDQDAAGVECEACGEPQFWSAFAMLLEREETV